MADEDIPEGWEAKTSRSTGKARQIAIPLLYTLAKKSCSKKSRYALILPRHYTPYTRTVKVPRHSTHDFDVSVSGI